MLTFFATPKPFTGLFRVIQRNAIASWRHAVPSAEILLIGDESGIDEAAKDFGARVVKSNSQNHFGTPFVDSVFAIARKNAAFPSLCYINSDILLEGNFNNLFAHPWATRSLLVGIRNEVVVEKPLSFSANPFLSHDLTIVNRPTNANPTAIDYFIFPKDLYRWIPPFALGRAFWDNWLVADALKRRFPVIDISSAVRAFHQEHAYSSKIRSVGGRWYGPEWEHNYLLGGGRSGYFTLEDATHIYELQDNTLRINRNNANHRRTLSRALSDLDLFESSGNRAIAAALMRNLDGFNESQ